MFLFPTDGMMELILSYGAVLSMFLVFVIMEGVIAAKTETVWPGLAFIGGLILFAIACGIYFEDIYFFIYMLIPVVLCLIAFVFSRTVRKRNIAKGLRYNKEGLIDDEINS